MSGEPSFEVPKPRRLSSVPPLVGKYTKLRPLAPADADFVFHLSTTGRALTTWRFRGQTPSFEQFMQALWQGVFVQFVAERRDSTEPIAHVAAYNPEFRNGVVYLAIIVREDFEGQGWSLEPAILLIDYLFDSFSFRKIYMESFEFNFAHFASGSAELFEIEGCLLNYEYHGGEYWHKYILALDREQWNTVSDRYRSTPN